jgi:exosortase
MYDVARNNWSTEQGGGGPIIMLLAVWMVVREAKPHLPDARPGSFPLALALLIPVLCLYVLARITGTIEVESFLAYALVLITAYAYVGGRFLSRIWFPLFFMLFAFPPPDTLVVTLTQPLKIAISQTAVEALYFLGYPVANSGVTIQIGQYEMLVAAACAGLNSLISLTSLGIFYAYVRHRSSMPYMLLLILFIVPIAAFVNLMRVLILLLVTYHFGEAAGQGFVHDLAGLTMFLLALLSILALDGLFSVFGIEQRLSGRKDVRHG